MNSAILIDLCFFLLFANTCTCLICNNGTVYVNNDGTVKPVDIITNISCTTQCVLMSVKDVNLIVVFYSCYDQSNTLPAGTIIDNKMGFTYVISYCSTDKCNLGLPTSDNATLWCNYGNDPSNFLNQSCTGSCAIGSIQMPTTTTTPNNIVTTSPTPSTFFYGCIPSGKSCPINGISNIFGSNVTITSCCSSFNNCNKASGSGGGGGGNNNGESGLSSGAVAGIVIGSVAGVGILGGGAAFAWKKKGKKPIKNSSADE